jgi:large subunit ribosomal protein L31e
MVDEENTKIEKESGKETVKQKKESKPAVQKETRKNKSEEKIELEREYIIPLRREVQKVPRYKKAKKAVKFIKQFLAKHMKVEERDTKKVKVDIFLNNEVWFRGIRKPANKIKVRAIKKGGIVYAELADVPEIVKFKMAREKKKKEQAEKIKVPAKKEEKPKEEPAEKKLDEIEKEKASVEEGLKLQKETAKELKHTSKPETPRQEQQSIHKKATKK